MPLKPRTLMSRPAVCQRNSGGYAVGGAADGHTSGKRNGVGSDWFDACFTEPYWEAYLFRACETGKLPGFRMVRACREKGYSLAEFMVLPPRRRQRLNRAAAESCFRLHPGRREVSPSLGDSSAYRFRERVLPAGQGKRRGLREMFLPFVQIPR